LLGNDIEKFLMHSILSCSWFFDIFICNKLCWTRIYGWQWLCIFHRVRINIMFSQILHKSFTNSDMSED